MGRGRGRGRGSLLSRSTPSIDPLTLDERAMLQNNIETLLGLVINYKNEEGRALSDLFLVKPSRRYYPDYYVLIKHPIALDTIRKRATGHTYTKLREFLEDIHLMFSNAKIYNEEGSFVYQDAALLEKLCIDKLKELMPTAQPEEMHKLLDYTEFDEMFL